MRAAERNAALALLVVVNAFHHVVAGSGAGTVDRRAAEGASCDLLGHRAGDEVDEVVRVAGFKRHLFPHAAIHQLRHRRIFGLNQLLAGFDGDLLSGGTQLELHVASRDGGHADDNVRNLYALETLGRCFQGVSAHHG